MLVLKIAFRNVFRQKRRTVLTVLTMFGGFVLASISIAWSDGSYNRVIDMFTRNQLGHIQLHRQGYLDRPTLYKTIDDSREVGAVLDSLPEVVSWTPRVLSAGLVSVDEKSYGARIRGIHPEKEQTATRFDQKVIEGRSFSREPSHEAVLGRGLARNLHADIGDEVVILTQGADGSIANDLYTIVGIIDSGDRTSDQTSLYLHITDAQELLVLEGRVHEIAVVVSDLDAVNPAARTIEAALDRPEIAVATWQEFAAEFYRAMKVDKEGAYIMLSIIMIVVAVGVLNTVLMTVLERRREYGLLRAVGTSPGQVFGLVLIEVFFMTVASLILGVVVGYAVNYWLSFTGISLGQSFTYGGIEFSRLYTEINARSYYLPAVAVTLVAMLVSLFPARKAAHVLPARAMRMH